jgi:hypothetical protein
LSRIKKKYKENSSMGSDIEPVVVTKSKKSLKTLANVNIDE